MNKWVTWNISFSVSGASTITILFNSGIATYTILQFQSIFRVQCATRVPIREETYKFNGLHLVTKMKLAKVAVWQLGGHLMSKHFELHSYYPHDGTEYQRLYNWLTVYTWTKDLPSRQLPGYFMFRKFHILRNAQETWKFMSYFPFCCTFVCFATCTRYTYTDECMCERLSLYIDLIKLGSPLRRKNSAGWQSVYFAVLRDGQMFQTCSQNFTVFVNVVIMFKLLLFSQIYHVVYCTRYSVTL